LDTNQIQGQDLGHQLKVSNTPRDSLQCTEALQIVFHAKATKCESTQDFF
jgi:hypothetical protein